MTRSTQNDDTVTQLQAAKVTFMQAIQQGMEALMECGYSRERATMILMRELQRVNKTINSKKNNGNKDAHKMLRPTDDEVRTLLVGLFLLLRDI